MSQRPPAKPKATGRPRRAAGRRTARDPVGLGLFQELFERSSEGITVIADRVVRYCNPSLALMVGREVSELVGTPFTDHIHPDELQKVAGFYRLRMEGGTPPSVYEAALRHRNGHRVEVEINAGVIPFEGRTADFVFIRDVSDAKWTEEVLRQSENLYRALFENSGTPMIFVEEDTTISLANHEFERLSGYDRPEIEGKLRWTQLVADPTQLERMKEYHRLRREDPALAPSSYEFSLARRDGTTREVAVTVVVMPGTRKSLASFLDITERHRTEDALRSSEERFRTFFENTFLGIYRTTPSGRITMANPALLRMLGFETFEKLAERNLEDESLASARERADFKRKMERDGVAMDHQATWHRRDGSVVRVRENARCVRDPGGKVLYYEGAVEDITEQVVAEEKTRELQLQLESILESTRTGLDIIDSEYNLRFVDQGWQKVYGPYHGRKCYRYFMDRDQPCPGCGIPRAFETRSPVVSEEYLPKEDRFIQVTSIPFQDKKGDWLVSEVNVDITERKRAEERVRESESRYRTIFENSGAATIIIEPDTTIAIANSEFARWSGHSREELEGKMSWTSFVDSEDLARMKRYHAERRQDGADPPRNYDFRFIDRRGEVRDCYITVAMIPGSSRSVASLLDITDRKRAEAELRRHQERLEELVALRSAELAESEEKHRLLLNSIQSPILALDRDMRVIYCNTAYAAFVGMPVDQILGRNPFQLFPAFRQTQTFAAYQKVLEEGQPQEVEGKMGDRWINAKVFRTPWGILSIAEDVTQRRLTEQALLESERRVRNIVESAPFGALLYELVGDGRLILTGANRAADQILGIDHAQMIGLTVEQAFPGLAQTEIPGIYRQVAADGRSYRNDQIEYDSGGVRGVYEVNAFQTSPGRMAVFFRDVTERQQAERLRTAIYEASDSLSSAESLDSFWPVLHREVGNLVQADNFFVALYDAPRGRVTFPYFVDEFDPNPGEKPLGRGLTDEVLRTGRPLFLVREDFNRAELAERYDVIGTPCHSWIGVPLKAGEQTFGAVVVQSYSRDIAFGWREQQAVNHICQRVAAAVANKRAEEQVRANEQKFRSLFEQSNDAVVVHDLNGLIHDVNSQACLMFGYSRQEFLGRNLADIVPPGSPLMPRRAFMQVVRRGSARFESQFLTSGGGLIDIEVSSSLVERDRRIFQSILRDITERKRSQAALATSEQRFRSLYEQSNDAIIIHDIRGQIIDVNPAACALFGYSREAFSSKRVQDLPPPGEYPMPMRSLLRIVRKGSVRFDSRFMRIDGTVLEADVSSSVVDRERRIFQSIIRDITEYKRAAAALRESEQSFRRLFEQSNDAIVIHDIYGGIREVNARASELLGYGRDQFAGLTVHGLQPSNEVLMAKYAFQKAISRGTVRFETRLTRRDGVVLEVDISSALVDREHKLFQSIVRDITSSKQAQRELRKTAEELSRSNRELEQFAYVASHDLQEPLRMISSYLQLLERRYRDRLDGDASEFIGYAVEGASRMRAMINDLLNYSRVTTKAQPLKPVSLEDALKAALANLTVAVAESGASVTHDPLPEVMGDGIQLVQLLQNLVANAIKFRREEAPRVHLTARPGLDGFWQLSVRDNGIGIDPQYADRIFLIFQRLHTREEYPGTGIGLAVCQKIVERHGGRIWVESQAGQGATFHFTLPRAGDSAESK